MIRASRVPATTFEPGGCVLLTSGPDSRPTLTPTAVRRWVPRLVRRSPYLVTAYLLPGRVDPRLREATMLGVTSVNRCVACQRVHERWGAVVGLAARDPAGFPAPAAAAYRYGQSMAAHGPRGAIPAPGSGVRHRRELEAAAIVMQLANLTGNRFLPDGGRRPGPGALLGALAARLYDLGMRAADRGGLRHARVRVTSGAVGDVLEIGIGTGLNLRAYPADTALHAVDPSRSALAVAARRARRIGRPVTLWLGDATALPYPDDSFDVIVATFVLCSVGDIPMTLRECRRVLRPGGSLRVLEHGRSRRPMVARSQTWLAPVWAGIAGGCRLDHDVRASIESAGLVIDEERARGDGLLMEIVAANETGSVRE
jgi:SAM-dependent methyltransferase